MDPLLFSSMLGTAGPCLPHIPTPTNVYPYLTPRQLESGIPENGKPNYKLHVVECPVIGEFHAVRLSNFLFFISLRAKFQGNSMLKLPNPLTLSVDLDIQASCPNFTSLCRLYVFLSINLCSSFTFSSVITFHHL
jgi:hypothetical protein